MWIRVEGEGIEAVFELCENVYRDGNSVIAECDEKAVRRILERMRRVMLRYPP